MSILSTLMGEAATVAESPVVIPYTFDDLPEGYDPGESITIRPITVETWFRMRPYLASIAADDLQLMTASEQRDAPTDGKPTTEAIEALERHGEAVFEIVLLGIHNRHGEPPAGLREAIRRNSTWGDLYVLLNAILFRLGGQAFLNSITVLKAVSPLGGEEMIALQQNAIAWKQRAASASSQPSTRPLDTPTERPSEAPWPSSCNSCESEASLSTGATESSAPKKRPATKKATRPRAKKKAAANGDTSETLTRVSASASAKRAPCPRK